MSLSSLKQHFCDTLKKHIKASKVRQLELAEVLELSPSAVSQMLSGRINPNLKQLDAMCQLLSLDRKECADLRDCLLRIRSGDDELRSPLNDFIKSSRTKHGLTIDQLAYMTGIPVETIFMLENKLNVQPTPQEAVKLASVFGCQLEEFWQVVPDRTVEAVAENNTVDRKMPPGILVMHETGKPYKSDNSSAIKTPVIKFDCLRYFDIRYDHLLDFAWRHMSCYLDEHKAGVVIVEAAGRDFGWDDLYNVRMEITDAKKWIAGMTVIGVFDGDLVLGKALSEFMKVIPIGTDDVLHCQHCWTVCSLCFNSEFWGSEKDDALGKVFRRNATVLKNHKCEAENKDAGENE